MRGANLKSRYTRTPHATSVIASRGRSLRTTQPSLVFRRTSVSKHAQSSTTRQTYMNQVQFLYQTCTDGPADSRARPVPLDTLHRWPLQAVQKALPAAVLVTAVFRSLLPKPRATLRRATLRLATSYSATSYLPPRTLPPRSGIDGTELLLMLPGRAPHGERHDERHDERRSERSTAHALYR